MLAARETDEDYAAALQYLYSLPDLERGTGRREPREELLLERPAALLERLGHPERNYPIILVAGTKGKGSTAVMLASILQAAGNKTGLFTKPHLHTFRERIQVNREPITKAEFVQAIARIRSLVTALQFEQLALGQFTTFEVTVALALDYLARTQVDIAVVEVGLGGRLDATNVVDAELAVITSISLDHTGILGNTLEEIAREKAGIIKPSTPVLSSPQRPEVNAVIISAAAERHAPLGVGGRDWFWSGDQREFEVRAPQPRAGLWDEQWHSAELRINLTGAHQLENAATAVAASAVLAAHDRGIRFSNWHDAVVRGLANAHWPARLEVLQPGGRAGVRVVIDGAHNGDSAQKLAAALKQEFKYDRLWLVLGVYADKDLPAIVDPLAPLVAQAWAVSSRRLRSRPASEVAQELAVHGVRVDTAPNTAEAIAHALRDASADDLVLVTGSLSVAAEAREALGIVPDSNRDPETIH